MKQIQSPDRELSFPTEEQTALWVALNRSQRTIYRSMDSELKSKGLPPLRWYDVLWELERARKSGLRPFEIENRLLFEQSNLSRLLARLVETGLVEASGFADDGRGKVLKITAQGMKVRKRMWKVYGPQIQKHMSRISDVSDLKRGAKVLQELIDL